jgi:DNA-binding response OmpR family regulator
MKPAYILVIEDDEIVARTIERSLRGDDYKISIANSGVEGLKIARRRPPDLVIMDIIMPGMNGYTVCQEIRSDPIVSDVPILILTAKIKDEDKIAGFSAGADDYLTKPFNVDELVMRVEAILRRTRKEKEPVLIHKSTSSEGEMSPFARQVLHQFKSTTKIRDGKHYLVVGDFVLDTKTFELYTPAHGKIRLTPVQYDLLYHLMCHPDQIFSTSRLLDEVWNYPADAGSPDLVRVHIKNLRERVEANPRSPTFIRTVPGYGYTVNPSLGE